jgi:heptosyltransferase-3
MKKILFISTERIGDSLVLTPTIRAVSEKYRNCKIDLVCKKTNFEIFDGNPYIQDVIPLGKLKLFLSKYTFQRKIYDICFCYSVNLNYILYASKVSKKVICHSNKNLKNNINNIHLHHLPPQSVRNKNHIAYEKFELSGLKKNEFYNFKYDLVLKDYDSQFGKNLITKYYSHFEKLICLKIKSDPKKKYRDWPLERFIELISLVLGKNSKVGFIIIGSRHEESSILEILEKFPKNVFGHYNQSIKKSASIICYCDLYIGVDTGMTHIASCFNIPIIGLYHQHNPMSRGGPLHYKKNFSLDMKDFTNCNKKLQNLGIITAKNVYHQIERALNI